MDHFGPKTRFYFFDKKFVHFFVKKCCLYRFPECKIMFYRILAESSPALPKLRNSKGKSMTTSSFDKSLGYDILTEIKTLFSFMEYDHMG